MKDHALVTAWEDGEGRQADSGLEAAWAAIRAGLRRDIGARMFDQWLKPVRLGDYCPESQTLDLLVATDFSALITELERQA